MEQFEEFTDEDGEDTAVDRAPLPTQWPSNVRMRPRGWDYSDEAIKRAFSSGEVTRTVEMPAWVRRAG